MMQGLPIGLAWIKAGNTSENLLSENRQKNTYFMSSKGKY